MTSEEARIQLAKDVGDYIRSTTTALADAQTGLTDTALIDQNVDLLLTKQTSVYIKAAQTGGPVADEERASSTFDGTSKLVARRNFSVTLPASIIYEMHRWWSGTEKNDAITAALALCFPIIWKRLTSDVTMVADQYDYDITATGYYQNSPRQVRLVSASDTELDQLISDWRPKGNQYLHIEFFPVAGRKLRLEGIGMPAIADVSSPQSLIVSARAAMYLCEQAMASAPNDQIGRYGLIYQNAARMFVERVVRFAQPAMAATKLSDSVMGITDVDWSVT